jgi:hypothetical protein
MTLGTAFATNRVAPETDRHIKVRRRDRTFMANMCTLDIKKILFSLVYRTFRM